MRFTFPRSEHLKSRTVIDRLFDRGKPGAPPAPDAPLTAYAHPFRVLFFRHEQPVLGEEGLREMLEAVSPSMPQVPPCRVLVSVPKRAFKKAVDRNAVRRRIMEAYRLNKHRLLPADTIPTDPPANGLPAQIAFLYTAKTKLSFEEIEKGMKLAMKRIKS